MSSLLTLTTFKIGSSRFFFNRKYLLNFCNQKFFLVFYLQLTDIDFVLNSFSDWSAVTEFTHSHLIVLDCQSPAFSGFIVIFPLVLYNLFFLIDVVTRLVTSGVPVFNSVDSKYQVKLHAGLESSATHSIVLDWFFTSRMADESRLLFETMLIDLGRVWTVMYAQSDLIAGLFSLPAVTWHWYFVSSPRLTFLIKRWCSPLEINFKLHGYFVVEAGRFIIIHTSRRIASEGDSFVREVSFATECAERIVLTPCYFALLVLDGAFEENLAADWHANAARSLAKRLLA